MQVDQVLITQSTSELSKPFWLPQLQKNGKADVLISDLYVENTQLLKALEITKQRQKIAEKKNYLLGEKVSSLNKIVCDLNPSPLASLPYHYKCSWFVIWFCYTQHLKWHVDHKVHRFIEKPFSIWFSLKSWVTDAANAQEINFFLCSLV